MRSAPAHRLCRKRKNPDVGQNWLRGKDQPGYWPNLFNLLTLMEKPASGLQQG